MMSRKLIELVIDEAEGAFGVEAISLVKEPAIEVNWVAFNKEQGKSRMVQLAQIDEEQRTLIAPALVPDFKIVRFDAGTDTEYDVYFSKETVKLASELYMKSQRNLNHTLEHAEPVEGVSVVESWIVQDPKMDKANLYGFNDLNEGTWMVRAKVDNPEVWEKIKSGEAKGLSIEGWFKDEIVEMSKQKANKPSVWKQLYNKVTGRNFYAEARLGDGTVIVTEAENFEAGVAVYTLDEQGQPTNIANGRYTTEAGIDLEVYEGVLIEYNGEVKAVEDKAEAPAETPPTDLDAYQVGFYKALLKNRYAKKFGKGGKNVTLSDMERYDFYSDVSIFVYEYHDDVADILWAADLDFLIERYESTGGMLEPATVLHLKDTTTSRECDEIIEVLEDRGLRTKKF